MHDARSAFVFFTCAPSIGVTLWAQNPQRHSDLGCSIKLSVDQIHDAASLSLPVLTAFQTLSSQPQRDTHSTQMFSVLDNDAIIIRLLAALGYEPRTSTSFLIPIGLTECTARCMVVSHTMLRSTCCLASHHPDPLRDQANPCPT